MPETPRARGSVAAEKDDEQPALQANGDTVVVGGDTPTAGYSQPSGNTNSGGTDGSGTQKKEGAPTVPVTPGGSNDCKPGKKPEDKIDSSASLYVDCPNTLHRLVVNRHYSR